MSNSPLMPFEERPADVPQEYECKRGYGKKFGDSLGICSGIYLQSNANSRFSILKTEYVNLVIDDFLMTENND